MSSVEIALPSAAPAPREAREFLRETLQTWALDGFGEITELLAVELVSNVVRHVGQPMTLRAFRRESSIRVEVDDPSTEPPVLRRPDPAVVDGRGILLVASMAKQWGFDLRKDGKTVWFEIDVTTTTDVLQDP